MNPTVATLLYSAVILGIFWLDYDQDVRTSRALWIPTLWLMINASRPVSMWFQSGPTMSDANMDGSPLDAAIYGILILAGAIALTRRGQQVGNFLKNNPALMTYVFFCLVSTLWSDYSFIAFKRWIKSFGDIVMVIIVLTDSDRRGAIRRLLCRAAYVLIPISVLLIKYYPDLGRSYNQWSWTPVYCGVTTFKNLLGMTTLVCGLGVLWCFTRTWIDRPTRRWKHLTAQGIVLGMCFWIFSIADSMTSMSCFILAGTLLILANMNWFSKRKALVHIAVASAVGITVIALFFNPSGDMVESLGRNATLTGRTAIWHIVIQLASPRKWLGTGFESFWMGSRLDTVQSYMKEIEEAHNGYLEVYLNLGWAGVSILAAIIVTGYRHVMSAYRRDSALGSLKLALFTTGLIYSLTEAGFRMMSPVWLGFLIGSTYIPRAVTRKSRVQLPKTTVEMPELHPSLAAATRELV